MSNVEKGVDNIVSNADKVTENITNTAKDVTDKATATVTQATEAAKKMIEPYTTSSGAIYGLILVILVAGMTSYALYVIVTGVLFKKIKDLVDGTKIPVLANEYRRIPVTSFSAAGNGQRRSYTFWIYINDLNKYTGMYKHVLHIGDESNITNASPYIFLDKTDNKLYVRFATTSGVDSLPTPYSSISNITDNDFSKFMAQGIAIDYIPIQRWVHVAIIINENTNGGTVTAYIDGDMSNIVTAGDVNAKFGQIKVANINIDKKGDLYVGGTPFGSQGPGFSGLISKFSFFNYDLNQSDVYKDYNDGPIDGLLAKLGLGALSAISPSAN